MQIMFSSKTVEMTDNMKGFLQRKLDRLKKFPSLGIKQLQIIVDRVKRHGRTTSEAKVEVIADIKGRRYAFQEIGENLYQAFFRVYKKLEEKLRREAGGKKRR